MWRQPLRDLIRITVAARRPFECQGREHRSHGMIRVPRHRSFWTERQHDMRTKLAHMSNQIAHHFLKFHSMQLPIGIVEHDPAIDAQNLAGSRKFLASGSAKFMIRLRSPTMSRRLPRSEADQIKFSAAFMVEPQRPAKCCRFVVRMSSHAKNARHVGILSYEGSYGPRPTSYQLRAISHYSDSQLVLAAVFFRRFQHELSTSCGPRHSTRVRMTADGEAKGRAHARRPDAGAL